MTDRAIRSGRYLVFDVVGEVAFAVRVLDQQDFASLNVIPAQFAGCGQQTRSISAIGSTHKNPIPQRSTARVTGSAPCTR